ncbi:50S ribosomal protein L29 [Candidatus Pacearchaeota archaeon]|nr:50S ribosomal protein L29 [Candidatus Pacearchaeota archaeon]
MKKQDFKKMSEQEREKKLEELKMELIKNKAGAAKGGSAKIKQIKKMIARIITLNKLEEKNLLRKE